MKLLEANSSGGLRISAKIRASLKKWMGFVPSDKFSVRSGSIRSGVRDVRLSVFQCLRDRDLSKRAVAASERTLGEGFVTWGGEVKENGGISKTTFIGGRFGRRSN